MSWVVAGAEAALNAWLDIDTTVDTTLASHVRDWIEGFAELGPDRHDCIELYNDGARRTVMVALSTVQVSFLPNHEQNVIVIRAIGRPRGL
jgi:hypothetical protein